MANRNTNLLLALLTLTLLLATQQITVYSSPQQDEKAPAVTTAKRAKSTYQVISAKFPDGGYCSERYEGTKPEPPKLSLLSLGNEPAQLVDLKIDSEPTFNKNCGLKFDVSYEVRNVSDKDITYCVVDAYDEQGKILCSFQGAPQSIPQSYTLPAPVIHSLAFTAKSNVLRYKGNYLYGTYNFRGARHLLVITSARFADGTTWNQNPELINTAISSR